MEYCFLNKFKCVFVVERLVKNKLIGNLQVGDISISGLKRKKQIVFELLEDIDVFFDNVDDEIQDNFGFIDDDEFDVFEDDDELVDWEYFM